MDLIDYVFIGILSLFFLAIAFYVFGRMFGKGFHQEKRKFVDQLSKSCNEGKW